MKKVIQVEKVEYICDKCGDIPEYGIDAIITFQFGYGSNRDGDYGVFHFCSKCAGELWDKFSVLYPNLKLIEEDGKW